MKVIYPIYLSLPSPLARSIQIVNTCYQLAKQGVEVDLICARDGDVHAIQQHYGLGPIPDTLTIKALPALIKTPTSTIRLSSRLPWDFFLNRHIRKSIKAGENPILYLREMKTAKALLALIKHHNLASVYEAHRIEHRVEGEKHRPLEEKIYATVSQVACITGPLRDELHQTFPHAHTGPLLPSGCTPPDTHSLTYASEYLFYTGQLYRWKGVDTIISMMKYLPHEKLLIAGGAHKKDLEHCKNLATTEGVAHQVTFLGQLPPAALPPYAAKAKALLLPNGNELYNRVYTSPIKLFEYLCYGKPIIASKLPTIEEIITDNTHALLAEADTPPSFADAVTRLNTETNLATKLGEEALKLAPHYSWETRATTICKMLRDITHE